MTETTWEVGTLEELAGVSSELLALWRRADTVTQAVVIALSGDLGSGKTTFVQQLARQLGVTETVTSPTFVIMKSYQTTDEIFSRLIHIDAYRLEDEDEIRSVNFAEHLSQSDTLICIEWAEKVSGQLPPYTLYLRFESLPNTRHKITYYES